MYYENVEKNKKLTALIIFVYGLVLLFVAYMVGLNTNLGNVGTVMLMVFALILTYVNYKTSHKLVLASVGAKKADENYYNIQEMVSALAIAAGTTPPKLYIMESEQMNAFATGLKREDAVICLTTGIINGLEKSELEAVIAHELTHILNFDIRVTAVLAGMVGAIALIGNVVLRWGSFNSKKEKGGEILWIVTLVFLILAPIISTIIQMLVSRTREYMADAGAVGLTRNPDALKSALIKISSGDQKIGDEDAYTVASIFIEEPDVNKRRKNDKSSIFDSHPSLAERINAIDQLI